MDNNIREPKQKRAVEKKEKILEAGFELICENGYYNTNTAEIAKKANVSTGIVYQYFKDKHDILVEAVYKYGDKIFFPMFNIKKLEIKNIDKMIRDMINHYIKDHKVSKIAHEEIMSMVHSDHDIASYYYKRELDMTKSIKELLLENNFKDNNLDEKIHVIIGMIDNLCHEVTYHKHKEMNYEVMTDIVIDNIKNILKKDLIK